MWSILSDSVTPWAVAHQSPLSIRFPKQEYWNGLPFPPPGDRLDSAIKPRSPVSLLHCRWILYHWVTRKDPIILLDAFNSAFLSHFDILISFMLSHYSASSAKPKFVCPSNKRGLYWITRVRKPSVFWHYSTFNFPFLHTSSIFLLMSG